MKIGILTQPLHNNYGGLLQAFALQVVLKRLGHEVWTVDFWKVDRKKDLRFYPRIIKSIFIRAVQRYLLGRSVSVWVWPTNSNNRKVTRHLRRFVEENIKTTSKINNSPQLSLLKEYHFDAYVVGSDQVWRPEYSPNLLHYFLDFLSDDTMVKRISYAASFGVEDWEFTPEETVVCAGLAQKFDAISVREDSAIELCRKYLELPAVHVLDPTMLLDKDDYIALVNEDDIPEFNAEIISYVLDATPEKKHIINAISEVIGVNACFVNNAISRYHDNVFPPVTQWIRGYMDTDFVITDSFHGTVFSIIFNRPFIAIGNEERGLTRFVSLLKMFDLENRLLHSADQITAELINEKIDWDRVNSILSQKRQEALVFLTGSLS
ncbi:MAG: polysaccharide pyruvyl transferase family protein [Candidatus Thiodiazotropha sp. (ex Codakia orbicularis)]|nr:polysaccharide pyruvyl transferase family protein [Candidatus Thiodiazotropha sp. (ex Codakia orbicularis)]